MMQYTAENLLVRPAASGDVIVSITPENAGWEFISFQARRLATGARTSFDTGENEFALVNLTGRYAVSSNRGSWSGIGGRTSVFSGGAHALYLPRRTQLKVTAEEGGEFAVTWVPTDRDAAPWLIHPENVKRGIRGGDNVSRQMICCRRVRRCIVWCWSRSTPRAATGAAIRPTNMTATSSARTGR
jgi:5-deoxy-glucuronate isomerase